MKNPFSILKMHVFISQLMTLTYEQNCRMQLNLNQLEKVLAALVVALTAIGGLIIVGITNFVKLNKIVCDLKGIK